MFERNFKDSLKVFFLKHFLTSFFRSPVVELSSSFTRACLAPGRSPGSSPTPRSPGRRPAERTTTPTCGTSSSSPEKKSEKSSVCSEEESRAKKFTCRAGNEPDFWPESSKSCAPLKKLRDNAVSKKKCCLKHDSVNS